LESLLFENGWPSLAAPEEANMGEARLAREAAAGPMLYPALGLPDETPTVNVRFSSRIMNELNAAGVKTVGEIREASDATLLSFQDLGPGSVDSLRKTLGQAPKPPAA
jgi:DNA-directed RNA polymerase alpha subunit